MAGFAFSVVLAPCGRAGRLPRAPNPATAGLSPAWDAGLPVAPSRTLRLCPCFAAGTDRGTRWSVPEQEASTDGVRESRLRRPGSIPGSCSALQGGKVEHAEVCRASEAGGGLLPQGSGMSRAGVPPAREGEGGCRCLLRLENSGVSRGWLSKTGLGAAGKMRWTVGPEAAPGGECASWRLLCKGDRCPCYPADSKGSENAHPERAAPRCERGWERGWGVELLGSAGSVSATLSKGPDPGPSRSNGMAGGGSAELEKGPTRDSSKAGDPGRGWGCC